MSKTGIPCYRSGGCGPYEMYSCNECPASKSDYLQRDIKDYPPYLDYPKPRKPMTNADRIRSMTDKELAEWMETNVTCASCPVDLDVCRNKLPGGMSCKEVLFDWLKSPVTEGA